MKGWLNALMVPTGLAVSSCQWVLPFSQCTADADCGVEQVCTVDQTCQSLYTEQCSTTVGPFDDPNAIRLGGVMPLSGPNQESGKDVLKAVTLALSEIESEGGVGGKQARPLALLACDDEGEAESGVAAAEHLVDVVGVPAIVGAAFSTVTIEVADKVAVPSGVLMLSPSATAVAVEDLDDEGLVWSTAPSDTFQADTLGYFGAWRVLEEAQTAGTVEAVRVGVIHADDVYGEGLSADFETTLTAYLFGRDETPNFNIQSFSYDARDQDDVSSVMDRVVAFMPHVLLMVGYEEGADMIQRLIDNRTTFGLSLLLTDGIRSDPLRLMFDEASQKPDILFGVLSGSRDGEVYESFESRYLSEFGGEPPIWSEQSYDAVYILAYALAAIDGDVTGQAIKNGLEVFTEEGDTEVNVGTEHFVLACAAMADGDSVSVIGASGRLLFNENGGRKTAHIGRWEIDAEESDFADCGVASAYTSSTEATRDWCAARCLEDSEDGCIPKVMGGGDSQESSGTSDDTGSSQ